MTSTSWNNYLAITWDKYLPPIRPYNEELSLFKRSIQEFIHRWKKNPSVLILGSTPELRDVVYEYNIQPTVVDYDRKNYEGMSILLRNVGTDRFIETNWLDLTAQIGKYDFIFSEAAFNVVGCEDAKKLYGLCHDLLEEGGRLIAKQWIRFLDSRPEPKALVAEYRESDNTRGFYSYLCIPLMLCFYDFEQEQITLRQLDDGVRQMMDDHLITFAEQRTVGIHDYQKVDLALYIPRLLDFMNDLAPYFNMVFMKNAGIAHSEYHPIFVLEKK